MECSGYFYLAVSNKSTAPLSKRLIVTVFDSDSDPVDNDAKYILLGPVSGDLYPFDVKCSDKHTYAFRFEWALSYIAQQVS